MSLLDEARDRGYVRPNGDIDFRFLATIEICQFWDWLKSSMLEACWAHIDEEEDTQTLEGRLREAREIHARIRKDDE